MIKTGIPTLDEHLKGGIPIGKTLIYYSIPFIEGDVFGMQTVYTNLSENGVCYFVASNCAPDVVRMNFKEYGWDLGPHSARFAIVDMYSALVGSYSPEPYRVEDPQSIESVDRTMAAIIESISPGDMIAFSSLSSILDMCSADGKADMSSLLDYVKRWNKMAVLKGGVVVYNFTDWGYDTKVRDQVKHGLCNACVLIGGVGGEIFYGQYFQLYACDWVKPYDTPTLFKVIKPGGVKVHIPKVLVTGPPGAGKSTFVKAAASMPSDKSVSVDRSGTTVALDYAHITMNGFTVDVFGTPGQKRFNTLILKTLAKDAMGIILVVDSTNARGLERALEMLKMTNTKGVPFLIAANKQDVKGAMDVETIRKKMNMPEDVPIIRVSAMNRVNVRQALETLIGMITGAKQ